MWQQRPHMRFHGLYLPAYRLPCVASLSVCLSCLVLSTFSLLFINHGKSIEPPPSLLYLSPVIGVGSFPLPTLPLLCTSPTCSPLPFTSLSTVSLTRESFLQPFHLSDLSILHHGQSRLATLAPAPPPIFLSIHILDANVLVAVLGASGGIGQV